MLTKIQLSAFQAHDNIAIDFAPNTNTAGLSTIVGPTDAGKSSILRAVRWVCLNCFQGDAFVRNGHKAARVVLEIDGHEIVRFRGKGGLNLYFLDGEEFKAFGVDVPEPIQRVLRVAGINFTDQHQPVYWFSETAGEVSRQLNSIVDLGVIDESLARIASKVREYQELTKVTRIRLESAKLKRDGLLWVEPLAEQVADLQMTRAQADEKSRRRYRLETLCQSAIEHKQEARRCGGLVSDLQEVIEIGERAYNKSQQVREMTRLVNDAKDNQSLASRPCPDITGLTEVYDKWLKTVSDRRSLVALLKNAVKESDTIEASSFASSVDLDVLQALIDKINRIREKIGWLERAIRLATRAQIDVDESTKSAFDSEAYLRERSGGLCPICGNALSA